MLILAETPEVLLESMTDSLTQIHGPWNRHWLILPGRGRPEYLLQKWARKSGIAARFQQLTLRVLLEQVASGDTPNRFDFDTLRLSIAPLLKQFSGIPPLPHAASFENIDAAVLDWARSIAQTIDDAMLCRPKNDRWEPSSFLETIASSEAVQKALEFHLGNRTPSDFESATKNWFTHWKSQGGLPHLWIQIDSGLPFSQFSCFKHFLELLSAESPEHLHLFALSPSSEYWGDAQLRRNKHPANHDPIEQQDFHPGGLLWALGKSSQDLHRQLADTFLAENDGGSLISSPQPQNNLLGRLHASCRTSTLTPPSERQPLCPDDHSLSVHAARSPLREMEVCRDRILQALHEIPSLKHEEILLLLADPKRQAPFVEAAFRSDDLAKSGLPFRLLGFGQSVPSPLGESLSLLLHALRGRLTLIQIQSLLENPLIAQKFGFRESDAQGENVVSWLEDAGFRWGINPDHRHPSQPIEEHRWNLFWALQRLGFGSLLPRENPPNASPSLQTDHPSAPLERATGLSLASLAQLAKFADLLQNARSLWGTSLPRPISEWNESVAHILEHFFLCQSAVDDSHRHKILTSILPNLAKASHRGSLVVTADGFLRLLEEKLASLGESGIRGRGGVVVADLREYAGVPARMILIAGLDEGSFPRKDERPQWHPMNLTPKIGDPLKRDADRHALLMAVLACRERLVLSYQGGSDEDAKPRPPSTALADLLQAVDLTLPTASNGEPAHHAIVFKHPLNGFSPEAFSNELQESARSQMPSDFLSAKTLHNRSGMPPFPGPWTHVLPAREHDLDHDTASFPISELECLFDEPCKLFTKRLHLSFPEIPESLAGDDLLSLNQLEKWNLTDLLIKAKASNADLKNLEEHLAKAGLLPRAEIGKSAWQEILKTLLQPFPSLDGFVTANHRINIRLTSPVPPAAQSLFEGTLNGDWYWKPDSGTALLLSASKDSLKQRLKGCLAALLLAANWPSHQNESTPSNLPPRKAYFYFSSARSALVMDLPDSKTALHHLNKLLPLLSLANRIPLPFWPDLAETILKSTFEAKTPTHPTPEDAKKHLSALHEKWAGRTFNSRIAPALKSATRFCFRGCHTPLTESSQLPEKADWLPDPDHPLAWRIIHFLHAWMKSAGMP